MRILIVEDEAKLAELVADRLKKEKYSVDISYDGEEGLYNALMDIYDLIILDIMLPYKNGIEILKEIKENNIKSKVIMLTAKSELEDKLLGFSEGANDYISKPFHILTKSCRINGSSFFLNNFSESACTSKRAGKSKEISGGASPPQEKAAPYVLSKERMERQNQPFSVFMGFLRGIRSRLRR